MKKIFTTLVMVFFIVPLLSIALAGSAQAQVGANCTADATVCTSEESCVSNPSGAGRVCCSTVWGCYGQQGVESTIGLGNEDPRAIAANVVNIVLGFLGIIAVVLILAGGFIWMTAAGNEDKVSAAKNLMASGLVGLIIVLAAFGIATFVVNSLLSATGIS
ncbi:MAG: pilin [bacterium]|nr:pilin [bacterium]